MAVKSTAVKYCAWRPPPKPCEIVNIAVQAPIWVAAFAAIHFTSKPKAPAGLKSFTWHHIVFAYPGGVPRAQRPPVHMAYRSSNTVRQIIGVPSRARTSTIASSFYNKAVPIIPIQAYAVAIVSSWRTPQTQTDIAKLFASVAVNVLSRLACHV